MGDAIEIGSWILLGAGSIFCVIGGIGLLRFPEFYSRMHAAGITDTLGTALLILGMLVYHEGGLVTKYLEGALDIQALFQGSLVSVKLIMILAILWLTSPASAHAIAKAARSAGQKPMLNSEPDP